MADHVPKRDRVAIIMELTESAGALGYKWGEAREFVEHELKAMADQRREERKARRMQDREVQKVEIGGQRS